MALKGLTPLVEQHLFPVEAPPRQFNPYAECNTELDRPDAPALRRQNLRQYFDAFEKQPPLFLLAEAPGPWGCRFSGVPLVSEAQLVDPAFPLDGQPSSTKEAPHTEYSASIFWRVMQPLFPHFFVWNSVPFHPHDADEPLSIRNPTRGEVRVWSSLLEQVLAVLAPARVVAVGRKAERALDEIGVTSTYVRHPSQGGAKKFEAGMHTITQEMSLPAPA